MPRHVDQPLGARAMGRGSALSGGRAAAPWLHTCGASACAAGAPQAWRLPAAQRSHHAAHLPDARVLWRNARRRGLHLGRQAAGWTCQPAAADSRPADARAANASHARACSNIFSRSSGATAVRDLSPSVEPQWPVRRTQRELVPAASRAATHNPPATPPATSALPIWLQVGEFDTSAVAGASCTCGTLHCAGAALAMPAA